MRLLSLCFAAFVLLAACGDDDDASTPADGNGPTTTVEEETTTTTEPTPTTELKDPDRVELAQSCSSPEGFTISYPDGWGAVADCSQFGPAPLEEPAPQTDEVTGVVSAFIDPVAFDEVSDPIDLDGQRSEDTVDGFRAVRIEGTLSGEGMRPEGTEAVRWFVDLTVESADEPATLLLAAYDLAYDGDFDELVEILDAMVASLEIDTDPPAGS